MKRTFVFALVLISFFATTVMAESITNKLSKEDLTAIKIALNNNVGPALKGKFNIIIVKKVGNFVQASIVPKKRNIDGAEAILKKTSSGWVVLDLGTGGFDEESLRREGAPKKFLKGLPEI